MKDLDAAENIANVHHPIPNEIFPRRNQLKVENDENEPKNNKSINQSMGLAHFDDSLDSFHKIDDGVEQRSPLHKKTKLIKDFSVPSRILRSSKQSKCSYDIHDYNNDLKQINNRNDELNFEIHRSKC